MAEAVARRSVMAADWFPVALFPPVGVVRPPGFAAVADTACCTALGTVGIAPACTLVYIVLGIAPRMVVVGGEVVFALDALTMGTVGMTGISPATSCTLLPKHRAAGIPPEI